MIDRLSNLASDINYIVRTYDRSGNVDVSFRDILDIIAQQPQSKLQDYDPKLKSKLSSMAMARSNAVVNLEKLEETECAIADLLYRIKFRESGKFQSAEDAPISKPQKSPIERIISLFLFFKTREEHELDLAERAAALDAPLSILKAQLEALRGHKHEQKSDLDILKLSDEISELVEHLFPPVLKAQADLSDDALKELLEENDANILLTRAQVTANIASKILKLSTLVIVSSGCLKPHSLNTSAF